MCGIVGVVELDAVSSQESLARRVSAMTRQLRHRGPDDEGIWLDQKAGVALGHRRLAIVDLSPAGHQPMISADGSLVVVYNGEIYNADELRRELVDRGHRFVGHSDTEVLVEGCIAWGIRGCIERLIGMFALAVWDRSSRSLSLVRDRLGIKPLYWGRFQRLILFGSELKALRAHDGWDPQVDRDALGDYMRYRHTVTPRSIFQNVSILPPGHILEIDAAGNERAVAYWDLLRFAAAGETCRSDGEATDQLEALLRDAVARRMAADVPVGAFLSGGIDSSVVAAMMQHQSHRPVRSFSIGFREARYDEAPFARAVAAHLGTEHVELYVEPQHALDVIPRLPELFDEPFADASQIPTYLLAALTRPHVTVALSGDGGDELFAGYPRYSATERLWRRLSMIPYPARRRLAGGLETAAHLGRHTAAGRFLAGGLNQSLVERLRLWAPMLAAPDGDSLFIERASQWRRSEVLLAPPAEQGHAGADFARQIPDLLARMQLMDLSSYLPDDILTKLDRATMAVALEARVPILDHRIVEFALRLPRDQKVRVGVSKWLLRQVLARYLPDRLIDRPKKGFGVPIGSWLRGPLRDWAEDLLAEKRLREDGYFRPEAIRTCWQQHLAGTWNWQGPLWSVLIFQAWLRSHPSPGCAGRADPVRAPLEAAAPADPCCRRSAADIGRFAEPSGDRIPT